MPLRASFIYSCVIYHMKSCEICFYGQQTSNVELQTCCHVIDDRVWAMQQTSFNSTWDFEGGKKEKVEVSLSPCTAVGICNDGAKMHTELLHAANSGVRTLILHNVRELTTTKRSDKNLLDCLISMSVYC